jgi:hypothetical protein
MLTQKELAFLKRWEAVRLYESTFNHKLMAGLPMALLFAMPMVIFFFVVKVFFPSWFEIATHRNKNVYVPNLTEHHLEVSTGTIVAMCVGTILVAVFFSYFRMHYKWEKNEQLYLELKAAQKKEADAALQK